MGLSKKVWDTLSAIDVNQHVEKKGNLSYLSWTWAWASLMEHYPDSFYDFDPPVFFEDGTCEVWVTVTVSDGQESMFRKMWLPVMDNRNNAIPHPDARKISDTRMRCLVKVLAMFGLGHYIYAGEDLPGNAPKFSPEQKRGFDDFLATSALGLFLFRQRVGDEVYADLYNSFESNKMAQKELADAMEAKGREVFEAMEQALEADDRLGVLELLEDETPTVQALAKSQLNGPKRKALTEILKAAA